MTDNLSCNNIEDLLSAYFDKELNTEDTILVKNHLDECQKCQKELNNIANLSALLKVSFTNHNPKLNISSKIELDSLDTCRKVSENLSAFLDKELEKTEIVEICEHLLQCQYCRKDYEELKNLSFSIKNYFNNSTENIEIDNLIDKKIILTNIFANQRQKKVASSIAALFFISIFVWFSINSINNVSEETLPIESIKLLNREKPMYVDSNEYFFSEIYKETKKEMISIIYENENEN